MAVFLLMLVNYRFPTEVIKVCQLLNDNGFKAFIVGGSIRDIIQGGVKPKDWDIATNAKPSKVMKIFEKNFRVIPTGLKHGTLTIILNEMSIEITTFRVEGKYIDGRRPSEVRFVGDIQEDLSRRDLTINAIAYDPIKKQLSDPYNGIDDIQAQIIRMVGDPNERLQEDGLRLIRIFRFVAQLGFNIEAKTFAAVPKNFKKFLKVAKERIHSEFQKILKGPFFNKSILLLEQCGLLYQIIPEFNSDEMLIQFSNLNFNRIELTMRLVSETPEESTPRLRFAILIHQLTAIPTESKRHFPPFHKNFIQDFLKQMKSSNKQIADVLHLLKTHLFRLPYSIEENELMKNYSIRKFLYNVKPEYLTEYLMFYNTKEQALQKEKKLTEELRSDILNRAKIHHPIEMKDLALNGDNIIQYLQINKQFPSQRELIGLCLQIIRERVEFNPEINQKRYLFDILENVNRIVSQCATRFTRRVRVVSTDHIRKIYRNGSPDYLHWENEHTYKFADWLILCLLRKDRESIVIFDGTNFNMPGHPTHRESLGNRFRNYIPLFINTNATESEVELNLQAREQEKSSIKKSDADLSIFYRYQQLLQSYPNALSIPKQCELVTIFSRSTDFFDVIKNIKDKIIQNRHRLIIISGNVLTGKTYIAYALQKQLEEKTA